MTSESSKQVENRVRWVAAITLGWVMAGHVLLETASDALFLGNVAIERLPLMTLAVAGLAVLASRGQGQYSNRRSLILLQCLAALGTLSLWGLVSTFQGWAYYALSIWAGMITSLMVVRFWLLLGDLFTITEGKRLFATIAMGGSIGALLGSGIAVFLAPHVGGEGFLVVAAGAFLLSALGPSLGLSEPAESKSPLDRTSGGHAEGLVESFRSVIADPYARRVAGLVVLSGITLTFGDFLFKSVLAEEVPPEQLAEILSRIYLALNALSITMLAIGVTPLVRRLGVDRSLAVLPALIGLAGVGVLAGGAMAAIAAIIFLKSADGTLRYSLHRTASELLYLPMSSRLRASVKGAIDLVGVAGAKGVAAGLLLFMATSSDFRFVVAVAVVVSASVWFVSALRLRHAYLNVFRRTLREGMIETAVEHPELDLQSAASLIRALNDPDERRVIAAVRLLEERGQIDLVPSLILYHPSPRVVTHALDTFAMSGRDDLHDLLNQLIEHSDGNVRAATVRAFWALEHNVERLHGFRNHPCLAIRISAVSGLLGIGEAEPEEYRGLLSEAIDYPTYEPRLAVSIAARLRYHRVNRDALLEIAKAADIDAAREAIRAIRVSDDAWFTAPLVGLLDDRRIREDVREALIERGNAALAVLAECLIDPETPIPILRHLPRTIALFEAPEAAVVLIDSFARIESGMVRFKLLRGLEALLLGRGRVEGIDERLMAGIDLRGIQVELDRTLERALELLHMEAELTRSQELDPSLGSDCGGLLVDLLRDKRDLATGRVIMMLGLMHPGDDFKTISTWLRSPHGIERASAEELVETLLGRELARMILSLVVSRPAREKLVMADPLRSGIEIGYTALICRLVSDGSLSLRTVALYHAGAMSIPCELDDEMTPTVDVDSDSAPQSSSLQVRALTILRSFSERRPRRPVKPVMAR